MAPIYMTPPSSQPIQDHIRTGRLGMIATPAQGNIIRPEYQHVMWDNGVFGGTYPGDTEYLRLLAAARENLGDAADNIVFATAPDVVGCHWSTWARSRDMLPRIRQLGYHVAYVAQDGMEHDPSCWMWGEWDALFIGGSTRWKLGPAAASLARTAHEWGQWVHVGRVNSGQRYRYAALEMRADSVDGTLLTNGPDKHLASVLSWAQMVDTQGDLLGVIAHDIDTDATSPDLLQLGFREPARGRQASHPAAAGVQTSLFETPIVLRN